MAWSRGDVMKKKTNLKDEIDHDKCIIITKLLLRSAADIWTPSTRC